MVSSVPSLTPLSITPTPCSPLGVPTTPDLPASPDSASFYEDTKIVNNIKQQINFDFFKTEAVEPMHETQVSTVDSTSTYSSVSSTPCIKQEFTSSDLIGINDLLEMQMPAVELNTQDLLSNLDLHNGRHQHVLLPGDVGGELLQLVDARTLQRAVLRNADA